MSNNEQDPLDVDSRFDHSYSMLLTQLGRIDQQLQLRLQQMQEETAAMEDGADPDEYAKQSDWQPPVEIDETLANSRLGRLVQRFDLTPLERDLLLLALLPHVDTRYQSLFAQAQGQSRLRYPTVNFALNILCPEPLAQARHAACLLPQAPLLRQGLIKLESAYDGILESHGSAMLKLDPALHHHLAGHDYLPLVLSSSCQWLDAPTTLAAALDPCLQQLQRALGQPTARIVLRGLPGSGRAELVAKAAHSLLMPVLQLDLAGLPEEENDALPVLIATLREAQLHAACLVLKSLPELAKNRPLLHAHLGRQTPAFNRPLVILQDATSPICWLGETPQIVLELPPRSLHQDLDLLASRLGDTPVANDVDLEALAQRFPIVATRLPSTLQEAELYRRQRDSSSPLQHADLHRAFQWRSQQNFGELAQRIEPKRGFDDLIVPQTLQQQLDELRVAIQQREYALAQGFGNKMHYGLGISALFHGASGAGKTMAAEVMAATLGVDLIKIDLSTVVNKYIGETEKNLSRVFDLAAMDSGVLFFDEADALFGKRSESKDANDRHANIEVAYLLQRMEAHTGLIILSTNNRSHLDNAFSRRFTFIVKFELPDHATRVRLWQAAWPTQVKLHEDVDFEQLADMADITGANIRNIALAATWLAADAGEIPVSMLHIQHALKRELAKTGQLARH